MRENFRCPPSPSITVSAVSPWCRARRDCRSPSSVVGPVLRRAFLRLASICRNEVIGGLVLTLGGWIGADVSEGGFRCASGTLDHAHVQKCLHSSATRAVEPGPLP
jgi:hypothetical protein